MPNPTVGEIRFQEQMLRVFDRLVSAVREQTRVLQEISRKLPERSQENTGE